MIYCFLEYFCAKERNSAVEFRVDFDFQFDLGVGI